MAATIVMHRGDLETIAFDVVDSEGNPVEGIDEIYWTVKRGENVREYLTQKRLSTGGIIQTETGYQFDIEPQDTDGLGFGSYPFDIEIVGVGLKKTFVGKLVLLPEVTHAANEGV